MSLRITRPQRQIPGLRAIHERGHLPSLTGLSPGDDPLPAPHPLQRLELPMLRVDLDRMHQQIRQHAIGQILRPPHRLHDTEGLLDQVIDADDLLGWRGLRQRRQLDIEHMFDYTPDRTTQQAIPPCPLGLLGS